MSLRQLHARLKRLEERIPKPAHSLATDEERRARAQELGQKWWRNSISDPITAAERRDINYLKKHYPQFAPRHPLADAMDAIDRYLASVEPDERIRQQQQEWMDELIDSYKKKRLRRSSARVCNSRNGRRWLLLPQQALPLA
jgi:hypothetical protein